MKALTRSLIATALVLFGLTGQAVAEDMKTLNFGIISTESSQNLRQVWDPFLKDMEKQTGMEVKAFFAPDYAGIIQGMRFDKVDVAWYGNKSAMEAIDRAGGEIFAQTVDVTGNPGYWSLLVTSKDSPLNTVDDIFKNPGELTFGNGDPNSTSGYLVPSYYVFAKRDVQPKNVFKRVLNSNHESNLLAAATGQVDFATNNTESLARLQETHPEKAEQIKVLWKSPLIPADPIVWRKNLPESAKTKIWNFFMDYGKGEREANVLADLQWAPFKASSNDQLIPIRQLALFKQRAEIENSDSLSAEEKSTKLAEIDANLASLERRMAALDARD
ncbi:phosphonate ABC transporter substrate-binding protein [Marinobacter fonticola]|uniref:phosphonate ABC transporter substrate-binding protein n=1 Tax=Marinobacter fonticola TaxID=2603215 RepID=UPI0011E60A5D|nr:phosphonate ABC transporter substrate-binding protein [Marinobacter fonticola]